MHTSLLKDTFFNLCGSIVPALVAIPALGYAARELNTALFGMTMLILAVVGYASIFDAGLGKAVVRHISIYRDKKSNHGKILGTGLIFVLISGGGACLIVFSSARVLALSVFNVEQSYLSACVQGIQIGAFCIPSFLAGLVLQSYLEGVQEFRSFNVYRAMSGILSYLFPVIALALFGTFQMYIVGLLAARMTSLFLIISIVSHRLPISQWRFSFRIMKELFRFGSWLTVTNIISPFMVYMDRFIIAKLTGPQSVAFYTAPGELVNRMSILPVSISRAVFPRLAATQFAFFTAKSTQKTAYLFMLLFITPIVLFGFIFSPILITAWLGESYANAPVDIFRILLIGFLFNSIALIPYSNLQANGLSSLTAKIHLVEVLPYFAILVAAVKFYDIVGASVIWSIRMFFDMLIMLYFDTRKSSMVNR